MNINQENYREVAYKGLKLFFDKNYKFHIFFKHKLKTRKFPYYKNIIQFLSVNPEIRLFFTLDDSIIPFKKINNDFFINMNSYLGFCKDIQSKTTGRIKAFLGQNLKLKDFSPTQVEKDTFHCTPGVKWVKRTF